MGDFNGLNDRIGCVVPMTTGQRVLALREWGEYFLLESFETHSFPMRIIFDCPVRLELIDADARVKSPPACLRLLIYPNRQILRCLR